MASNTTTYDVLIKLRAQDPATEQLKKANAELEKMSKRSAEMQKKFDGITGAIGKAIVALGLFKLAQKTIGTSILENIEAQNNTRLLTNSLMMSQGVGRAVAKQWAKTIEDNTSRDEEVALAGKLTDAVADAGGSVMDLANISKQTFMLAKAFGLSEEEAAETISKALRGNVSERDKLARVLNINPETFNKQSDSKRLAQLKKALGSKAVTEGFSDFEQSFDGTVERIKKVWKDFLEAAGKPLFEEVMKALNGLVKWTKENGAQLKQWAATFGKALVSGFNAIGGVLSYIKDNAGVLTAVFLAMKGASLLGSAGGGKGGLAGAIMGVGEGLGTFAGKLNLTVGALSLFALGVNAIANSILEDQEKKIEAQRKAPQGALGDLAVLGGLTKSVGDFGLNKTGIENYVAMKQATVGGQGRTRESILAETGLKNAVSSKLYDPKTGQVDLGQINAGFGTRGSNAKQNLNDAIKYIEQQIGLTRGTGQGDREEILNGQLAVLRGLSEAVSQNMMSGNSFLDTMNMLLVNSGAKQSEADRLREAQGLKPQINIAKVEIKVASDDPDRFAMGLEGLFLDIVKNPSQASMAQRVS